MKILLVYPSFAYTNIPYGGRGNQLFYLYSYLREHAPEVEVDVLDINRELPVPRTDEEYDRFLAETERFFRRSGFDVLGISCWTTHSYNNTMAMARLARRIHPGCTIVVGGFHATFLPQDFTGPDSPVDIVVTGDGEVPLLQIARGVLQRGAAPQVVAGPPQELGAYPLRWGEYRYHRVMKALPVWMSRGCPFACAFCADRLTRHRSLTPADALAMLQRAMSDYPQVEAVHFYDPLFGIRKDWRREFLALLIEADLPLHYWAEARVDLYEEEDLDLLARLPFRLDFGLESVVPELLAIMKKTTEPARYLQRFREIDAYMNRKKIPHTFNHIYNHPGETSRTLQESLAFWQRYYETVEGDCYTFVSVNRFSLYPGSDTFNNWPDYEARYGARALNREWWRGTPYPSECMAADIVPSRELAEAQYQGVPDQISTAVTNLAYGRVQRQAFRGFYMDQPLLWPEFHLQTAQGERYLDRQPLRPPPRADVHRKIDGTLALYGFDSHAGVALNRQASDRLRAVAEDGRTIAELAAASAAAYPDPEAHLAQIRQPFVDLLARGLLALGHEPPAAGATAGPARVLLRTSAGELELALYADAAPWLAANFLQLVGRGFYDGLLFLTHIPSAYIEAGTVTYEGLGAGAYTLPAAESGRTPRRGSLLLARAGDRIHASRFRLCRADDQAVPLPGAVIGELVRGWQALDGLLTNDRLIRAELLGPEDAGAEAAARRAAAEG